METSKDIIILITGVLTVLFHPNLPDTFRWFWFHSANLLYGSEEFLNTKSAKEFRRLKSWCNQGCESYIFELEKQYPAYLTFREIDLAVEVMELKFPKYFRTYIKKWFHTEGISRFYAIRANKKYINYPM